MQQDHLSGSFVAGGMPLAAQLRLRVQEVAGQQQILTDFQVETVRALQVLRQQQTDLLAQLNARSARLPLSADTAALEAPLPALEGLTVISVGGRPEDNALLEGAFATAGAFGAGAIEDAIACVKNRTGREPVVVHLFDPEASLRSAPDLRQGEAMADALIHKLKIFRRLGGQVVWTIAAMPATTGPLSVLVREMTAGLLANSVDRVHVHAQAHRLQLEARFAAAAGKVVVSAHPGHAGFVPNHVSRDAARRQLGIEASTRLVLIVADGLDEPTWRDITGAAQDVAASGLPLRLLPVALEAGAVPSALAPMMRPLGDRSRHPWLFKAADALLVPPRAAFSSQDLALAATFATPVLAAEGYGPSDGTGLVYDARQPQALRDALAALANRPDAVRSVAPVNASAGWTRLASTLYCF
ncbi:Glycosyltransferase involved in cell wall bisynthesis [Rhizobium sp. RU35A]|uniref:hypothetical protein n=1 Tax=Rhizobium sp. RU35A TaxID=1907414 RepID=UPI000954DB2F|nr:hypothetical protein [Rhizobium sp. RU35A]SIQ02577.1 Glycosyltransferase involved in cell wall bisynthesis [Rhizobium sp. RU35A]